MQDLMIDIETMGNSHNAVMIQLAGVFFDRETGKTGREFCENVCAESCLEEGFETNEATKKWWAQQDPDVLKAITQNTSPVSEVMERFASFVGTDSELIVWSHATFDFVIVQNYLKTLKAGHLPYRGARDIRTLVDLSGIDLNNYDWSKKTHNALDDCKFQIKYCVDAMDLIVSDRMQGVCYGV